MCYSSFTAHLSALCAVCTDELYDTDRRAHRQALNKAGAFLASAPEGLKSRLRRESGLIK